MREGLSAIGVSSILGFRYLTGWYFNNLFKINIFMYVLVWVVRDSLYYAMRNSCNYVALYRIIRDIWINIIDIIE